jgi:hypothetical protein
MKHFQFRDVAGRCLTAALPGDATVRSGCDFLAEQLSIDASRIRIATRRGDVRFCPMLRPLEHGPLFFQVVFETRSDEPTLSPSRRFAVRRLNVSLEAKDEYRRYARAARRTAADLDIGISYLTQMGFPRDACEDALRIANFGVAAASQLLTSERTRIAAERAFISGRPIDIRIPRYDPQPPSAQRPAHSRGPRDAQPPGIAWRPDRAGSSRFGAPAGNRFPGVPRTIAGNWVDGLSEEQRTDALRLQRDLRMPLDAIQGLFMQVGEDRRQLMRMFA